ncbi:MAG: ATP phosphoribosyltransferase regulatory subunit [Acidobacteriota bacterium]
MKVSGSGRNLKPVIPQGVQCYFGEEVNRRRKVEAVLAGIMKCWGFDEIILPFFDYLDDFSHGLGSRLGNEAYIIVDRDGSLLALRPDLTTLVAKTVSTRMKEHPLPIRLFYSGEVFRQGRSRTGKQKQFYQIGLESIGTGEIWADAEVLLIAMDCLMRLGVTDFKIALGHAGFFHGIVSGLSLSSEKAAALREAVDRKDGAWLRKEVDGLSLSRQKKRFLEELPGLAGGREILDRAAGIVQNPESRRALDALLRIHSVAEKLDLAGRLAFDLAEVRDLAYYTGIVFKIYGNSTGFELGGGGRYDDLLTKFGWDVPAVGFSFTLDRILPLVKDAGDLVAPSDTAPASSVAAEAGGMEQAFQRVWQLRRQGRRVRLLRGD